MHKYIEDSEINYFILPQARFERWHIRTRAVSHTEYYEFGNGCIHHLEDPGVDGRIKLRRIFRKWYVGEWSGSSWLRKGTSGGHVWMR